MFLRNQILFGIFIIVAVYSFQTSAYSSESKSGFWDFRLSQFSVFQKSGQSYAGFFSWDPFFSIGNSFGLRGEIGVGGAKSSSSTDSSFILMPSASLLLSLGISKNLWFEAGPGYQIWIGAGDIKVLTATGGVHYRFDNRFLKLFDGFVLNYTAAFVVNNYTHEIRAGFSL